MKVLLIGYGSIGKRHCEVLSKIPRIKTIDLVTKQVIGNKKCHINLEVVEDINKYDYFIIATETSKHFEQLRFLESKVKNKTIFCEKPLFEKQKNLDIKHNKVFVGYVLRFHPLIKKMKELLEDEKIILANVKCGQYLPSWRPNVDYRNSYSAKKEEGGGVLLDLSHEIDYTQWLCGNIEEVKSYQMKISDLEIDSDDFTTFIGKTDKDILLNVSIDYISKNTHRKLLVETFENTLELDFISNKLLKKNKLGLEETYHFSNLERNYMFEKMHLDILGKQEYICTFEEAYKLMNTIAVIQEQNK